MQKEARENWLEGRRCGAYLVSFLLYCVDKLRECGDAIQTDDVNALARIEEANCLLSRYASHSEEGFDAVGNLSLCLPPPRIFLRPSLSAMTHWRP